MGSVGRLGDSICHCDSDSVMNTENLKVEHAENSEWTMAGFAVGVFVGCIVAGTLLFLEIIT